MRGAEILARAKLPLISGMGTDMAGAKAAFELARGAGAVIDHMSSEGLMRELSLLTQAGGFITTIGETRTRADLVMVVGDHRRTLDRDFFDRIFPPHETLPRPKEGRRKLILFGGAPLEDFPPEIDQQAIELADIELWLAVLSALVKDQPLSTATLSETKLADLKTISTDLKAADFAVIVCDAETLSLPALHGLRDLVNQLNGKHRASVLPVSGPDNVTGVNQLLGWSSGFPLRTSFARGKAYHDPWAYDGRRLLTEQEIDALLWISVFSPEGPDINSGLPTLVIGPQGLELREPPEVYIEVGVPGKSHDGISYSGESGALAYMKADKPSSSGGLPEAAEILTQLSQCLKKYEGSGADTT